MIDNTLFYVASGPSVELLRDQVGVLCGVDPTTILLCPALGYTWEEPGFYAGKTLLQWYAYQQGDYRLELEVLLGGARLGVNAEEEVGFFCRLSAAVGSSILLVSEEGSHLSCSPGGHSEQVRVALPEEYGAIGPRLLLG